VPTLITIDQAVVEKNLVENVKIKQTDGQPTTGDQKSSLELSAQVS
jgi:hypothetical protein